MGKWGKCFALAKGFLSETTTGSRKLLVHERMVRNSLEIGSWDILLGSLVNKLL